MLALRHAVAFCAFKKIPEQTTVEKRRRKKLSLRERKEFA
jgi:hypothetical protein